MARRRVQYGVVNASDADVGAGAPGLRTTWHSKDDLRQQVLQIGDVPNNGKLYFWDGELWLRWDAPDDLPGPEQDPLRIKIVCPQNAGLFTLKNILSRPLPLLEARLSPRSSKSQTISTAARTFSDIHTWPEFVSEARQLEDNLDDITHAYKEVSLTHTPGLGISSPADECEVRGALVTIMHGINNAAQIMGIGAECVGGGSGRSLSFTDLVVRKRGQSSNPEHLSALVLGAGEVKGAWQLDLQRGEKLEDMLHDPKRIDTCVLALHQAYGDAVVDEAPLLFVSNYHCTVFLKRSEHVFDKTLWASEPIWWDQQHPSARSCWLKFLCIADEMQDMKSKLPRMVVPRTVDGYMLPQISIADPRPAASRSLRPRPQTAIRLVASSSTRKDDDLVPPKTAYGTNTNSLQQQPVGTMKGADTACHHAAHVGDLAHERELSCEELGLTDTLIGNGQYGQTLLGAVAGKKCAVKLYDSQRPGGLSLYFHEKECLQALATLACVARLEMAGRLQDTSYPCIVTAFAGNPVSKLTRAQRRTANEALTSLHAVGACHGDIRLPNFLFKHDGSCVLADLAHCVMDASQDQQQHEKLQLSQL